MSSVSHIDRVFYKSKYLIVRAKKNDGFIASVYLTDGSEDAKGKSRRLFDVESNISADDLIVKAEAEIESRNNTLRKGRKRHEVPTTEEYIKTLEYLLEMDKIKDIYLKILTAHYKSPNFEATPIDLAKQTGFEENYEVVNLHYGAFGGLIGEDVYFEPQEKMNNRTVWTFVIADDTHEQFKNKTSNWIWTLRPQVVEAIDFLKLCK